MHLPNIDPVFLRLGPLEFRWYGLMYIISFMSAFFIIRSESRRGTISLGSDTISDIVFFIAMGIVLGGRSGYILFYNLSWYLANPLKVFAVWEGGMSFHGGFIGGVIAGLYICRKHGVAIAEMADIAALTVPVGLGFGRIGNFINGELYGRVTDKSWGVIFPAGGGLPRHPSQLYEAFLEGLVLLLIVWGVRRAGHPKGVLLWIVVCCYGIFRFSVEFFREPDQQLGFLWGGATMGQLLSLPMAIVGGAVVAYLYKRGSVA